MDRRLDRDRDRDRDRDGSFRGRGRGMGPPPHRPDFGGPLVLGRSEGSGAPHPPYMGTRDRGLAPYAAGLGGPLPAAGLSTELPPPTGAVAPAAAAAGPPLPEIDREKTCPLLMRVFTKRGGHHRLEEFAGKNLPEEMQFYTWMDATLRELTDLLKSAHPAARNRSARLSFAFIYPDRKGRNVMRQVGSVHSTRIGDDDEKALRQLNFQTGDYLDVAIF